MTQQVPQEMRSLLAAETVFEVPETWVPGLDAPERRALYRLGIAAGKAIPEQYRSSLPDEVVRWLGPSARRSIHLPQSDELLSDILGANSDELLAEVYAKVVHSSHRRMLGTFFTPLPEVTRMLDMWDRNFAPPSHVVDVGAGVGVFTAAAARRWPDCLVTAVDINPVTLGLLAVRLFAGENALADRFARQVQLIHADFTLHVGSLPKAVESRLILGNPPFTRSQLIPKADRERFAGSVGHLCGARSSLSTIITAQAIAALSRNDGLCLLLPAQWLEASYASKLRNAMWAMGRRRVEMKFVEAKLFREATVDAVTLLIGPEEESPGMFVSDWSERTPVSIDRSIDSEPENWRTLFDADIRRSELKSPDKYTVPIRRGALVDDGSRSLGSFANVRRGVATGANSFFILSRSRTSELGLPSEALHSIVTRMAVLPEVLPPLHELSQGVVAGADRFLLLADETLIEKNANLANYIAYGEVSAYCDRYLCRQRKRWYAVEPDVTYPDVIVGSMSRGVFKFVRNSGAAISNNLYGLTWKPGVADALKDSILGWLSSPPGQGAIGAVTRTQAQGLLKIEPRSLREVLIPSDILAT